MVSSPLGDLRDGASLPAARAELETINHRLAASYPATNRDLVPTMATHAAMNSGPDAPIIWGSLIDFLRPLIRTSQAAMLDSLMPRFRQILQEVFRQSIHAGSL
jgi:hypothetical protein